MKNVVEWILIKKDRLDVIFSNAKEKEPTVIPKLVTFTFGLLVTLVTTISTGELTKVIATVYYTITGALVLLILLGFAFKWQEIIDFFKPSHVFDDIKNRILADSAYENENTFIYFDAKEHKQGEEIEYLFPVRRRQENSNSYFFPYIRNAEKFKSDEDHLKTEEIKKYIQNALNINIPVGIKLLHELDNAKGTKLNKDNKPQDVHFQFIHAYSESPFLKSYLHKILETQEIEPYEYKSIGELKKDSPTLINNSIVISSMQDGISYIRKYIKEYTDRKTKIIWNIDKNCNTNCSICAFGKTNKKPMSLDQKKKIIEAMKNIDIDFIDFSTGTTPNIEHLKQILTYTKQNLQNTVIRITATANVIRNIGIDFIKNNKIEVDITYDYPHSVIPYNAAHRPDATYNQANFDIASELRKKKVEVNAHVVIHKDNTEITCLQEIKKQLNNINVKNILFIRLMPVGNQNDISKYPPELCIKETYDGVLKIIRNQHGDDLVELHCALRGLDTKDSSHCQIGCCKLGISQNGDIFTCPWAEHLNFDKPEDNPFFIGNIINEDFSFINILKSEKFRDILNKNANNQPHCKIFAYKNGDEFSKKDPLYI